MSDKYIIKNCPIQKSQCHDCYKYCQDCTDCVLKQIVELCKGIECPCEYKGADCWECTESGARRLADKICQLLDIQEVE